MYCLYTTIGVYKTTTILNKYMATIKQTIVNKYSSTLFWKSIQGYSKNVKSILHY